MIGRLRWVTPLLTAVGVVATFLILDPFALDPFGGNESSDDSTSRRDETEIVLATLSVTTEVDGELRPVERRVAYAGAAGTVTASVRVGDGVDPGSVLFAVDEVPTVALPGSVPAWRTMSVDTIGADVAQLETALAELGYDPDGAMTVDDTFTSVTAAVVEAWQTDVGLDVTGTVDFGSVVFVPGDARVVSVEAAVGQAVSPGAPVVELATAERELSFSLSAEQLVTTAAGSTVTFRLPDRSTVEAVVADIVPDGNGTWIVTALVEDAGLLPDGDQVPVTVSWSHVVADEVATVAAGALTRLDNGHYVVEVVESDGATRFVKVDIGASSGSTVEIITDLAPGTTVVG